MPEYTITFTPIFPIGLFFSLLFLGRAVYFYGKLKGMRHASQIRK